MPSFRQINYSVRPAKATERRMLGELFRRLYPFDRVEKYRYIGFGSVYFSDFQVIHRALGIDDMVSIERDTSAKECFEFNKPFRSIDMKFGKSEDVLPTLKWNKRSIVWLDYDGRLSSGVLSDVSTFCTNAGSGSVLIVSVNAQAESEPNEDTRNQFARESGSAFEIGAYRLAKLKENIPDRVPADVQGRSLRKDGVAKVFYRVLINQITEQIAVRNATLVGVQKLFFQQFAHFHYKDNALMLTIGVILASEAERSLCEACSFDGLDFVRSGAEAYTIQVPCLTGREIHHLNAQLPAATGTSPKCPGVSDSDIKTYSEVYRFFPNFGEILWT